MEEKMNIIKDNIRIKDCLSYYGIEIDRTNKCICPFHREKTASMKIYEKTNTYKCFGCGKYGDSIQFVQDYFELNVKEAVIKLNQDFMLGLDFNTKLSKEKLKEIKKQQELKKIEKIKRLNKIKLIENLSASYHKEALNIKFSTPKNKWDTYTGIYAWLMNKHLYYEEQLKLLEEK